MYWALEEPYPLGHETELSSIWRVYESLDDDERDALRACFDHGEMDVLFTYAARMATLAVRDRNSAYLKFALLAVSLGCDGVDYRDVATMRVLLIDGARRLDALSLFPTVELFASESMRSLFRDPNAETRSLWSMGFVVTEEDGFRYRQM